LQQEKRWTCAGLIEQPERSKIRTFRGVSRLNPNEGESFPVQIASVVPGKWGVPMLRLKSLLVCLLVILQLGCGRSPLPGPRQVGSPSPNPLPTPQPSPPPNISISPASDVAGSPDLTVTITASKTFSFGGGGPWINKVLWSENGTDTELSSTIASTSQLTAIVPATLLTVPVQAELRVEVWDHIEGTLVHKSSSVPFSVTLTPVPTPSIFSISPSTVAAGNQDVTILIEGSNFGHFRHFYYSTAFWTTNGNLHDTGTWLQTTIANTNQMTAVIPAKLLQSPTSVQIVVMNGDVMGMSDGFFGYPGSNGVTFTVTP
jgi:hypothetical protein